MPEVARYQERAPLPGDTFVVPVLIVLSFQLMLEVRTILAFLLESMRLAADASERHKFVPDVIPSYVMVHVRHAKSASVT